MKRRAKRASQRSNAEPSRETTPTVRIIGGEFRGSKLSFRGDPRTRPMKDRLREAVFDLLGPEVRGTTAVDLFAGTGALAFEALSRGANRAVFVERHFPTAELIRADLARLGIEDRAEVVASDTFFWARQPGLSDVSRWLVFCSPPYAYYQERRAEMQALLGRLIDRAPAGSIIVAEGDDRLDLDEMPASERWTVRRYGIARLGILRVEGSGRAEAAS